MSATSPSHRLALGLVAVSATALVAGSLPSVAAASAAQRGTTVTRTAYAMSAAGFGTRVRGGDVPVSSGTSSYDAIGCTNKAGVAHGEHVESVDLAGLGWSEAPPFEAEAPTLGAALLVPTRLYVRPALASMRAGRVHALAHITGGGLTENLPRVLPEGLGAEIDLGTWSLPPVFTWLAEAGGIGESELLKTFNSGIGMVVVTAADSAETVAATLVAAGETVHRIGHVVVGHGVRYSGRLG